MTIETTLPAICRAADAGSLYHAALAYDDMGICVIPTRGKEPAVPTWRSFQSQRPGHALIQFWHDRGYLSNVAVVCGAVSGNLVVMDLDGEAAFAAFVNRFPKLLDTYTVRSGSGQGYHLYYYVDALPKTTRVTGLAAGNIELRADGCYVVAPPSTHPTSGRRYTIARALPIMRVQGLKVVSEWIKQLIAEKHGGTLPPARNAGQEVKHISAWAAAAVANEAANVMGAAPGDRNNQLNRSAFKLGQIVGAGKLPRDFVERQLMDAAAALAQSDGVQTVEKTIKSGLDAGIKNPRQV